MPRLHSCKPMLDELYVQLKTFHIHLAILILTFHFFFVPYFVYCHMCVIIIVRNILLELSDNIRRKDGRSGNFLPFSICEGMLLTTSIVVPHVNYASHRFHDFVVSCMYYVTSICGSQIFTVVCPLSYHIHIVYVPCLCHISKCRDQ